MRIPISAYSMGVVYTGLGWCLVMAAVVGTFSPKVGFREEIGRKVLVTLGMLALGMCLIGWGCILRAKSGGGLL